MRISEQIRAHVRGNTVPQHLRQARPAGLSLYAAIQQAVTKSDSVRSSLFDDPDPKMKTVVKALDTCVETGDSAMDALEAARTKAETLLDQYGDVKGYIHDEDLDKAMKVLAREVQGLQLY